MHSPDDSRSQYDAATRQLLDDPVRLGEYGLTLYQLARLRNLGTLVQDRLKRDSNMNILLPREEAIKLYVREEALNEGLAKGLKEGLSQGLLQGLTQGQKQLVLKAYAKTRDAAAVADLLDLPLETVQAWVNEAS
jgi:DNA-directed RNA polymerase specialized sigma24 family protein